MTTENSICSVLGIKYPILQGGMAWVATAELAAAVSNAGGLGLIGSGSMYPDQLRTHIRKCKAATQKPFGVNVPLLYPDIEQHMQIIIEEEVPIVFTSAGSPKTWTPLLKQHGITVVHVVSSTVFAIKCQNTDIDTIIAEEFETKKHNGREETTTLCLIPAVADAVSIPVIAAGGIGDGRAMLACMALGASGVQIGSRFVASLESSAHAHFKEAVLKSNEGSTVLTLKEITPVRLIKNAFYSELSAAYARCATPEELRALLGRGRAKKGMFEGDLDAGELEIGQVSAMIKEILPAGEILTQIWNGYLEAKTRLQP